MDQLTLDHPRWQEFIGRLEQRLNFRERSDEPGNYQWLCGKGEDPFAYTREVLTAMGLQPEASLAIIRSQRHVCCDCEIVFNPWYDRWLAQPPHPLLADQPLYPSWWTAKGRVPRTWPGGGDPRITFADERARRFSAMVASESGTQIGYRHPTCLKRRSAN